MGRPLKFPTVADLQAKIDDYFESCWKMVKVDEATERQQIRPYSITGLALFLDTSRQTLLEYEGEVEGRDDRDPGYADAIKRAKLRCENYAEEGLLSGDVPAAPGIFNLKNNYGWKDEQHQKHTVENLTDLIKSKLGGTGSASKPNTQ